MLYVPTRYGARPMSPKAFFIKPHTFSTISTGFFPSNNMTPPDNSPRPSTSSGLDYDYFADREERPKSSGSRSCMGHDVSKELK